MVLAAREHGCVAEMLVIASALSVPDPRDRPLAKQQAADQAHLLFRDERSDFLSLLALWQFFDAKLGEKLTHRRLVDACRAHFVSYLRLREWRDVHAQLASEIASRAGSGRRNFPRPSTCVKYQSIHSALLAGLIGNIGTQDGENEGYAGAAESGSSCIRGRASRKSARSGCWPPSSSKRHGSSRGAPRESSPNGSKRSRATA
jgi:ATP-dependent helicase HrpA